MSYGERVRPNFSKPSCWGDADNYDLDDMECSDCQFKTSCSQEVRDKAQPKTYWSSRTQSRNYTTESSIDSPNYESGIVGKHEKPIERFAKDAIAGALRGAFYEMWQFWKRYRIH